MYLNRYLIDLDLLRHSTLIRAWNLTRRSLLQDTTNLLSSVVFPFWFVSHSLSSCTLEILLHRLLFLSCIFFWKMFGAFVVHHAWRFCVCLSTRYVHHVIFHSYICFWVFILVWYLWAYYIINLGWIMAFAFVLK